MKKTLISLDNCFDVFEKLTYGINIVEFENEESKEKTLAIIEAQNTIFGFFMAELKPYIEHGIDYSLGANNGVFNPVEVEGVYDLNWKDRTDRPVKLTNDDLMIRYNAERAKNFEEKVEFTIHPDLFKFAKKIAYQYGVKFKSGITQSFSGEAGKKSLYQQIYEAYRSQKPSISFGLDTVSVRSVRVYASSIANQSGKKIRVSTDKNNVTVYFQEISKEEIAKSDVRKLFGRLVEEIGNSSTEDVILDVFAEFFPKPQEAIQTITTGNIEEEAIGSDSDDKEAEQFVGIVDNNQMFIKDPNESPEPDDDDDF